MTGVFDAASDGGMHAGRVEALREQVPMDPPDGRRFLERHAVPQPPVECLLDQKVFIKAAEHVRDRRPGDVARDAERFDLPQRAQPPMALHVRFRSRAGQRGAPVVQGALALETVDGRVDVVWLELAAREARPDLRFAQLTARKQLQPGHVGAGHEVIVAAGQKSKVKGQKYARSRNRCYGFGSIPDLPFAF